MQSLNWKFKKSLENLNNYNQSKYFKNQIEKGNKEILNLVIREIQIILTQPNEQPFAKFLSLRFCKDLILLGQPIVITSLQRIVPILIKICSYKLESKDLNRGSTYFQNHPTYIKAKVDEKQNLRLIGSSFLIICLQSIRIWANWIPVSQNGNESVFKKAYENLLQRKVTFCFQNQYYKKQDEQKFNKTYKIQFFDSSDIIDQQSEFAENSLLISEINKLQQYKKDLNKLLEDTKPNVQELERLKAKIWKFHIFTQQVQKNIENQSENQYQEKKNLQILYRQQVWSQNFLLNYNLLVTKKINFQDFIRQCQKSSQVNITNKPQNIGNFNKNEYQNKQSRVVKLNIQQYNINVNESAKKKGVTGGDNQKQNANFKKSATKNTNAIIPNIVSTNINENNLNKQKQLDILLKQQKIQFNSRINQLQIELKKKNELLNVIKTQNQIKQEKIKKEYEQRIRYIKQKSIQVKKNDNLAYEIKQLNDKIVQLEDQKYNRELQYQRKLKQKQIKLNQIKKLENQLMITQNDFKVQLENKNIRIEKLEKEMDKQLDIINDYINQLEIQKSMKQKLQYQTNKTTNKLRPLKQNQQRLLKENEKLKMEIQKNEKEKNNLKQELSLYKQQLNEIRNKHYLIRDKQIENHQQSNRRLRLQLEDSKKKNLLMLKQIDAKDIEIIRLNQINQNNQRRIKQLQSKKERFVSPQRPSETKIKTLNNFYPQNLNNQRNINKHVEFTKSPFKSGTNQKVYPVETIAGMKQYSEFFVKMAKQLYLRFCKACLKTKQLLYKQNQFQLGLITQNISSNRIKFVLHFTNNSEVPLKDFKVKIYSPKTIKTTVTSQCVTTIESLQQQKQEIIHEVISYPIKKINLEIQYEKNYKKESINLLLPVTIIKFCDFYTPTNYREKLLQSRQFKYSSRLIQNGKSLISYIKQFRQVSPNLIYDVQVNHRHSQLVFFFKIKINNNILILQAHGGDLSNYQKEILNEFINVMQFIFIK